MLQGHLNDTIVVNQPRLTTEDDQVIAIPDGNVELLMDETENTQVIIYSLYTYLFLLQVIQLLMSEKMFSWKKQSYMSPN